MIYPGKDGPIDSIRWEVFAESLQDYAILQTAGIKPDDPLLAPLKSYADFPKTRRGCGRRWRKSCGSRRCSRALIRVGASVVSRASVWSAELAPGMADRRARGDR